MVPYAMEVEYLQSTATSGFNIVTNNEFPVDCTFELKYKIDNILTLTTYQSYFTRETDVNRTPTVYMGARPNNYYYCSKDTSGGQRYLLRINGRNTNVHTLIVDFENKTISLDGAQSAFAASFTQYTVPSRMCLFKGIDSTFQGLYGKIYYFKITKNNQVLLDLIPIRIGTVGYMYDKITGQILSNTEEGTFVCGPDVAPVIYANEVAFLESWGNQYIDTGIMPSTDTKIELKCLYCKSGAGLTNYGALIGADDRDNAYILNHSAVANFTYGLEFSNNFANPQTRLLTFDSTASPQNMRVYDEGGSLVTTLTCLRGVFEVNQNLYLFATNRGGTPVYGSNRILYCKIYDGNTLVRDYVPVEYDGIGYMYDKVSGLFFDNKGTGKFLFGSIAKACARSYTRRQLMAENYVGKAPNGYKWLEYIENTSSAYINTGLIGKANLKIEADWLFKVSAVAGIMGASYNHEPDNALLYRANWTSGSYFYYGDSTAGLTALTLNKKWHIVMDKGSLYYDDVLIKTLATTGDSTYNFMLFKVADYGTCVKGQLFGCKIWDEVTLVRDYRPIKRLSDNKYGLWDKVHQTFYTSPNGVNFVGG